MDQSQLIVLNFLCYVNSRCNRLREERGIASSLITSGLKMFQMEVKKYRENKIKESTLIKRGSSFLAQFPDLQVRFWHLMEDPRATMKDQPNKTVMTGAFAPLEPFLVWSNILHLLSHIEAARMAGCCKWLRRMVTPRLLVSLRQPWEDSLPVTVVGGDVGRSRPLRLKTTTGQEATLYIIDRTTRLLGMGYEGKYYILNTDSVQDSLRVTWTDEFHTLLSLFQLLDSIRRAPADEPLDLRMWAKIAPLSAVTVSVEITAHGDVDPIKLTLNDDGMKYKFFSRGIRVFWGPMQ